MTMLPPTMPSVTIRTAYLTSPHETFHSQNRSTSRTISHQYPYSGTEDFRKTEDGWRMTEAGKVGTMVSTVGIGCGTARYDLGIISRSRISGKCLIMS